MQYKIEKLELIINKKRKSFKKNNKTKVQK